MLALNDLVTSGDRARFRTLADAGHAGAQTALACCMQADAALGNEGATTKKAIKLFKDASGQLFPNAILSLARCYEIGSGVSEDKSKAKQLYAKAAEAGSFMAQEKADENQDELVRHRGPRLTAIVGCDFLPALGRRILLL